MNTKLYEHETLHVRTRGWIATAALRECFLIPKKVE
jgi:hypothetical protein